MSETAATNATSVDWASRKVLAHRVSISMDTAFCVEALEEAFTKYGQPEIFNTDQGSQFTSQAFTDALKARGVAISMDGKGAWRDNVFVERLWRSIKYEEVYLHAYDCVNDAKTGLVGRDNHHGVLIDAVHPTELSQRQCSRCARFDAIYCRFWVDSIGRRSAK